MSAKKTQTYMCIFVHVKVYIYLQEEMKVYIYYKRYDSFILSYQGILDGDRIHGHHKLSLLNGIHDKFLL